MAIYVTGDTHGSQSHGMYSIDGFMHRLNTTSFPEQKELGKEVLQVENLKLSHDGVTLLDNISFRVNKDDKIVILSENENAVTGLLSVLSGSVVPDAGDIRWGSTVRKIVQEHREVRVLPKINSKTFVFTKLLEISIF